MKVEDVRLMLEPLKERAEYDGDKYCIVYFSQEDDEYAGAWELDAGDALIVIDELVEKCGLSPDALIEMYSGKIAEKLDESKNTGNTKTD